MANILSFFRENQRTVAEIVDLTFFRLMEDNESIFNRIAPLRNYVDVMLLIMKMSKSKPTIASLVADEQELPNSRARVAITEELLMEARIGKQHIFTNNDFKAMKRFEEAMDRKNADVLRDEFMGLFFGIAADLAPAILEKMTVLLINVLTKANTVYDDPLTEIKFSLTYPDTVTSGANQLLFTNAPLAADAWNAPLTANGLRDFDMHAIAYYNNFGVFPPDVYIRWNAVRDLANQLSTKRAFAAMTGYGVETDAALAGIYLNENQVMDMIRDRLRGGTVNLLDAQYSEESALGVIIDKYFLSDDTYFFAEAGNAERAFVPCPEKDFEPGIYVGTKQMSDAPRQERIAAVGAGIPVIKDSRKIAARRIK